MPYGFIAIALLALDQLSKLIIQTYLSPYQTKQLWDGWFSITFVKNYGAAFGIFHYRTVLLTSITVLIFILLWVYRRRLLGYPPIFRLGVALATGGAAGNFVDRVRLGYVVDFIDFRYWPVFNIADIGIVVGVGLITLYLLKEEIKKSQNRHSKTSKEFGGGES